MTITTHLATYAVADWLLYASSAALIVLFLLSVLFLLFWLLNKSQVKSFKAEVSKLNEAVAMVKNELSEARERAKSKARETIAICEAIQMHKVSVDVQLDGLQKAHSSLSQEIVRLNQLNEDLEDGVETSHAASTHEVSETSEASEAVDAEKAGTEAQPSEKAESFAMSADEKNSLLRSTLTQGITAT